MRTFILAFTLFLGLISAGTAHSQAVKGGGGGGLLKAFFPRQGLPCKDGDVRNYQERSRTEGHYITVTRVCKNGRFFQKSNVDYAKLQCAEGDVGYQDSFQPDRIGRIRKTYKCINGERVLIRVENVPQ